MKQKTKVTKGIGYKIVMSVVVALFFHTGCSAYPNNAIRNNIPVGNTDSVMRKAIGDSICNIIAEAKKIKAKVIKLSNDSTSNIEEININSKEFSLIHFITTDPRNFVSNNIVYGRFRPCFILVFTKKKETCIVNYDFGLKKWNICDEEGRVINYFDLNSDNMLRLANCLFPGNKIFESLINTEKK